MRYDERMEERIRIFFWALGGAAFFGGVGAVFGGMAGALARASGKRVGALVGSLVTRAMERVARCELPMRAAAILTGAVDGAFFLALVGSLVGVPDTLAVLLIAGTAVLLLAGGAVLFGTLAYALIDVGPRAVGGLFLGGMAGAIVGAGLGFRDGLFLGLVAGILLGALLSLWAARHAPRTGPAEEELPVEGETPLDRYNGDP
jgi:hypothetical protein